MMKKCVAALLCALLLVSAAAAEPLTFAAPETIVTERGLDRLRRYAGWTQDDAGVWSVCSYETSAALNQLSQEQSGAGTGYFCLQIEGDENLGLVQPVLVFYYVGNRAVNAETVCMVIGNTRYDFRVSCERVELGGVTAQVMRAPLNARGLAAVRTLMTAPTVRVKYLGQYAYSYTPKLQDSYQNTSAQIEGSSLKGYMAMLDELDAMGFGDYALWDLNARRWEALYGFEPEMEASSVTEAAECAIALNANYGMLGREDNSAGVRQLQELLIAQGFMQGRADGSYGDGTVRAVKAVRRYYGLIENGVADKSVIDCLNGESVAREEDVSTLDTAPRSDLGGVCEAGLARCWYAPAVSTAAGEDVRTRVNADDVLLIAEGVIENTSPEELVFYRQLNGVLTRDGARYACTVLVETDCGRRFDTSMLPGAEARLIVYAEVPRRLVGGGTWELTLSAGAGTLSYALGE